MVGYCTLKKKENREVGSRRKDKRVGEALTKSTKSCAIGPGPIVAVVKSAADVVNLEPG